MTQPAPAPAPSTGIAGRWYITPHALRRYARHVFGWQGERGDPLPEDMRRRALDAMTQQSLAAHFVKARPATTQEGPAELWRGPRPMRLRFIVAPAGAPGRLPTLVTVYPRTEDRPDVRAATGGVPR